MSDTDVSPLPMSTYTVIPYQEAGGLLRCVYVDAAGNPVQRNQLDSRAQGFSTDFVCLQGLPGVLPAGVPRDATGVQDVCLLAAVVKTLDDTSGLPNVIQADRYQRLVLPVLPGTRRGVILVFQRQSGNTTVGLIATSDPEIKNSTSA